MTSAGRGTLARLLPRRSDYAALPRSWRRDILAGATVGVVALPLALAFGISSGVGATAGLITAVVAGLVAAVFGGSHVQVSGPTGAMAVVLAPIVALHGIGSVALVTVLAGIIVLTMGVTGLGRAVTFIPGRSSRASRSVSRWSSFCSRFRPQWANQLRRVSEPCSRHGPSSPTRTGGQLGPHWPLSVSVALLMVVTPRLHRAIPESLAAVVAATVLVSALGAACRHHRRTASHLPTPVMPQADVRALHALIGAAGVAALAAIESPAVGSGRPRCRRPVPTIPTANSWGRVSRRWRPGHSAGCGYRRHCENSRQRAFRCADSRRRNRSFTAVTRGRHLATARCPRSVVRLGRGAGGHVLPDDLAEDGASGSSLDEIRCRHVRPDSRRHCLLLT